MKKIIFYLSALVLSAACTKGPEYPSIDGAGFPDGDVVLDYAAGQFTARVYTSGAFTACIDSDVEWLRFSDSADSMKVEGSGDATLCFEYDINRSIPRDAYVTLVCGSNSSQLKVTQDGLLEGGFSFTTSGISVNSDGGSQSVLVSTKIKPDDISFHVTYSEQTPLEWISNIRLQNNFLCFELQPNYSDTDVRHATISALYGESEAKLMVTQYYVGATLNSITVDSLKTLLPEEGDLTIDDHLILEAVVINDWEENNGGEIHLVSADSPDPSYQEKVVYVQNVAGDSGIKLVFDESCAQIVSRFNSIGVDLCGLTLKCESDPLRYSIDKVPVSCIVESESALGIYPRVRTLSELQPSDLYTYIEIPDVEIPVRKGNFSPIDIRYFSVIMTYPMLIRDRQGNSSFMMVNTNCSWSRDGEEMPHGSGSIAGVLVHEAADNFEWDKAQEQKLKAEGRLSDYITGLGNLCDYQIRPVHRDEVKLSENFADGFSGMLYEWAYCDSIGTNLVKNYSDSLLYPTYPRVENPMELDATFSCRKKGEKLPLGICNDFTHLGPYTYSGKITRPANGNGIYDYYGRSAHWYVLVTTSTIGVIYSDNTDWSTSNGSAWQTSNWTTDQYWCAEFATDSLTLANAPLSVQFGTMGCINGYGAPRYWAVEYSLDGTSWTKLKDYTVPDFVQASTKKVYQLPGTKYVTCNLPNEAIGCEKVYVRLVPTSLVAGSTTSYDEGGRVSTRYNAINYFSIRYNK